MKSAHSIECHLIACREPAKPTSSSSRMVHREARSAAWPLMLRLLAISSASAVSDSSVIVGAFRESEEPSWMPPPSEKEAKDASSPPPSLLPNRTLETEVERDFPPPLVSGSLPSVSTRRWWLSVRCSPRRIPPPPLAPPPRESWLVIRMMSSLPLPANLWWRSPPLIS